MIQVKGLYVNFYTEAGVVKVLDGVDFTIYQGETMGLVGETGCGKSVTANSIMRLIPQPPGKIEKGHIYFLKPEGTKEEIEEIQAQIDNLKKNNPDIKDNDPVLLSYIADMAESDKRAKVYSEIENLKSSGISSDDARIKELQNELERLDAPYDFLNKSKEYMQKIRGKYISMIFQEPMSALNPVFRIGDQISEIMLLHDRKELSIAATNKLELAIKDRHEYKRTHLVLIAKNEFKCSNCGATIADSNVDRCPGCNGFFHAEPMRNLTIMKNKVFLKLYKNLSKDPKSLKYRFMSRIPVIRRYEGPMREEALERSRRMLRLVKIPDPDIVVNSYPYELSGGMQQRVMIAMALACKPKLLIADEPTTALDVTIQAQILKLMKDLQNETGTSILLITHNLGVVAEVCDRVGVMYAGIIAEIGPKKSIFKEPLHPYTQGLMNSIPKVNVDVLRLETIEGVVPNLLTPPTGCRFHPRCPYAMPICSIEKPMMKEIRKGHSVACHLYGKEAN